MTVVSRAPVAGPRAPEPAGPASLSPLGALAVAAAGCVLAAGMHWTLVTNVGSATADSLDRYFQSWQLAWIGHAARTSPASMVDSNTFWPLDGSLAFSDAVYGYAPAGMIGSGPRAAMIRYNLVFLFTYALAFAGAALLARELGLSWLASVVAAAAFAFAPWRLAHLNHLHVLSSGGIPASLALLLRGYRRALPGVVLGGWVLAAWQLSLGFTLGIQLAYLLAVLAAVWFVRWMSSGRPPLFGRAVIAASAAGIVMFAGVGVAEGLPLLEVSRRYPESRRSVETVAFFSPPPSGFLAAPPDSLVWGDPTAAVRAGLRWAPEMALFPGLTLVVLVVIGLAMPVLPVGWRVGLALGVLVTAVLCLGYSIAGGRLTYGLLYDYAPGWQGSRTPGRLFTLTSLGLALLGAAGVQAIRAALERRGLRLAGGVAACLLAAAILAEGKAEIGLSELPVSPVDLSQVPEPQLHLPSDANDPLYMLWSTDGFPRIFNGYAGFVPSAQNRIRDQLQTFPDSQSVELLRTIGFRSVVVHLDRLPGTPWEEVPGRSIDALEVERRSGEGFVVFTLEGADDG